MPIIHEATVEPGKLDLARAWLRDQRWAAGIELADRIGSYRFDDPAGRVGVEFLLFPGTRAGRPVLLHLPLTYRESPAEAAGAVLVGTTEHSFLGTRYVYDGCTDPVAIQALVAAMAAGGEQEPWRRRLRDGAIEPIAAPFRTRTVGDALIGLPGVPSALDVEAGDATATVHVGSLRIVVQRLLGDEPAPGTTRLEVVWPAGSAQPIGVTPEPA